MTALRIVQPPLPGQESAPRPAAPSPARPSPASNPQQWVPIRLAARLLNRDEAHLRRECRRLQARGLAAQLPDQTEGRVGGRLVWHIHERFSPRLSRRAVEGLPEQGADLTAAERLTAAPAKARDEAATRAAVLAEFRAWRSRPGVCVSDQFPAFAAIMEHRFGVRISRTTLYRWDREAPATADPAGCAAALLDRRGRPAGSTSVSPDAWKFFLGLYLSPQQRSLKWCWDIVRVKAADESWSWCSYKQAQRLVAERVPPGDRLMARSGADAWRKVHETPLEQDENAWAAGECWESDHTQLDFFARVPRAGAEGGWAWVRPWLTAWVDRRSRRLMGWVISESGDSHTIRAALAAALTDPDVGPPRVVWLDNGKDFASAAIGGYTKSERRRGRPKADAESGDADGRDLCRGVLGLLGIEPHFAERYNHNGKARVERFFGVVHERFDKGFESWRGNGVAVVDEPRVRGMLADLRTLPTLDEVRGRFADWHRWYNAWADRGVDALLDPVTRQRLSAGEFYERHAPTRRVIDRGMLSLLDQVFDEPRAVTKHGISVRIAGRVVRYGGGMAALSHLVDSGKRVYVSWSPLDTSMVTVWDERLRLICVAPENDRHIGSASDPISLEARKQALRMRREARQAVRRRVDFHALTASEADLATRAQRDIDVANTRARLAEHRRENPDDLPALRLVETPLDGQAKAAESARMRLAAGAEHRDDDRSRARELTRLSLADLADTGDGPFGAGPVFDDDATLSADDAIGDATDDAESDFDAGDEPLGIFNGDDLDGPADLVHNDDDGEGLCLLDELREPRR